MKVVNSSKMEFAESLRKRTKKFAIDVIKMYRNLPKTEEARIVGRQLIKSATSVASNYRAACRARSDNEFYSKLSIVVEEADEAVFWMEILKESKIYEVENDLYNEANELLSIMSRSRKTLRNRLFKE
jgi:four helix bundle protein